MAHAQQQILNALQALLIAGATAAAGRVFVDRVDPLQASELPAILIRESDSGESAEVAFLEGTHRRQLEVDVACVFADSADAAAQARSLGLAAEKLIAASAVLLLLCRGGWGMSTSKQVSSGEGDRLLAAREQSWRFVYFVNPTAPDLIL
jgi:hypothetical protein